MLTNKSTEIKLKLSASNKSGVTAALHFIANKFGLKVKDILVSRVSRERSRVIVIFEGVSNVPQAEFTNAIQSHTRIYSIDEIEINTDLKIFSDHKVTSDGVENVVKKNDVIKSEIVESDTDESDIDESDFESIVKEVEDSELEASSEVNETDDTENETKEFESTNEVVDFDSIVKEVEENEFKTSSNNGEEDDLDSESDQTDSEPLVTMDIHYNKNSSLKESSKILHKFNANDAITDESLETTEQILIDLLGPIASLFVSTAVIEANTIGELFSLLSEELDGEVKSNFLGLIID